MNDTASRQFSCHPEDGPLRNRTILLELPADARGTLVKRPNRFLALVTIRKAPHSESELAHVHDPGRLKELLFPGNTVLLRRAPDRSKRKTDWDVLAARSPGGWTLIHSGFHREIMENIFGNPSLTPFENYISLKPEIRFGSSRLDFLMELEGSSKIAIETKGCSLVRNGTALFPDAPTVRGTRHLNELVKARVRFGRSAVCILVTNPTARRFKPFTERDPAFAEAFTDAVSHGVEASAHVIEYDGTQVTYLRSIPVLADNPHSFQG